MDQKKLDELAAKGWKVSPSHQKKKIEVSCNNEGIVITTYGSQFVQAEVSEQVAQVSNSPSNNQEEIIMTTNQTQAQETVQAEQATAAPEAAKTVTPEAPVAEEYGLKDFGMDVSKFIGGALVGAAGMFAYNKWFK